jgi:hypothetical protein
MSEPAANIAITLDELAGLFSRPVPRAGERLLQNGPLAVFEPDAPDPELNTPGRWQRLVTWQPDMAVLVDEFHASQPGVFALTVTASKAITGGGRRYVTEDAHGPLALHVLGDYAAEQQTRGLTFRQPSAHSRFLLAITRDPAARARIVNGWAVEIRTARGVHQLLHSNRSHRLRPLGPIQTEARYAGVVLAPTGEWHALGME